MTACCAVNEGGHVVNEADAAKEPRLDAAMTSAALCVAAVLGDDERRMTIMGGREGFARSLGSVYAGSVTRFLGGSIKHRVANAAHSVRLPLYSKLLSSIAVSRDGKHILAETSEDLVIVDRHDASSRRVMKSMSRAPDSVCVAPDGVVFVANWLHTRVQELTPALDSAADLRNEVTDFRYSRWVCANEHFVAVANSEASVLLFSRATGKSVRAFDCSDLVDRPGGMCFMKTAAAAAVPTVAVSDGQRRRAIVMCLEATAPSCVRRLGHDDMFYPSSLACSDAVELVPSPAEIKKVISFTTQRR
jgi:hypothetical protein